jgi:hypothetical protein
VAVGPGDMRRWDAHMGRHSFDTSSEATGQRMVPMGRLCGVGAGRRLTGGPAWYAQFHFPFFKCFQTDLNLNWSKDGILMLEHFQIKYGVVGN